MKNSTRKLKVRTAIKAGGLDPNHTRNLLK